MSHLGRYVIAALFLSAALLPLQAQSTTAASATAVTITVTASANPSVFGSPVTFTVVVAGPTASSSVPTGAVIASLPGHMPIGAATLDSTGTAMITVPSRPSPLAIFPWGLPAGTDAITFSYSGDTTYKSAQSSFSQFVNKADTTTSAAVKGNSLPLVLIATVSIDEASAASTLFGVPGALGGSEPTGTVQFFDGTTSLGTAKLEPSGLFTATAILTVDNVPASLTAVYSGDNNYNGSTSAPVVSTGKGTVGLTVTSTAAPATFAEPVTFSITAAPATSSATPTGTVNASLFGLFKLGSATLNGSGNASITVPASTMASIPWGLPAGSDAITFGYSGDANYYPVQTSFAQTVDKAATSTLATIAPSDISITATVSIDETSVSTTGFAVPGEVATTASPTGVVQFLNGSTVIGTAHLAPNGLFTSSATLNVKQAFSSSDVLTALYNGDGNYTGSTSAPATVPTTTPVNVGAMSSANPSTFAEPVTLSITIAGPTGGPIPTGTVQASVLGGDSLGIATLDSTGSASLTIPPQIPVPNSPATFPWGLAPGPNTITVSYSGDSNFAPGQNTLQQFVKQANTTTTAGPAPEPTSATGVTIGATVSIDEASVSKTDFRVPLPGDMSTSPTGIVQFYDGTKLLGLGKLSSMGLFQSNAFIVVAAAPSSLRAVYFGDLNYNGSSSQSSGGGTGAVTVTLASSADSVTYGAALTLVATVTPFPSGGPTPTGTLQFLDGTQNLGWTATLDSSGKGTLQFPIPLLTPLVCALICPPPSDARVLGAGSNSITAQYSGDVNYAAATSDPLVQQITKAPTNTSVSAFLSAFGIISQAGLSATVSDAQPPSGGPYHFQAITAGGIVEGDPTGTVTFYNGSKSIGTGTLIPSLSGNVASTASLGLTTPAGATTGGGGSTGTNPVNSSASYPGDANFQASGSTTAPATTVTLTSSPNPSNTGQSVLLTATIVTPSPTPSPTGKVTFLDGKTPIGSGPVSGGTATLITTFITAGSHSLTAVYSGDQNYQGATSAVDTQTVNSTSTPTDTLKLSAGPTTAVYGQTVILFAQVAGNVTAMPTGTVTFLDGTTSIGTAALQQSETYLTVTLAVGTHQVSAMWPGDTNWPAAQSAVVIVTVNQANTLVALRNFGTVWTALVLPLPPGTGTPTGTVQFIDTMTQAVLATMTLKNGAASANLTSNTDPVQVVYSGDSNFNAGQSKGTSPQPSRINR